MYWTGEGRLLSRSVAPGLDGWGRAELRELGGLDVPDAALGGHRFLLRADIAERWGRWFAESLADPVRYAARGVTKMRVRADVSSSVRRWFGEYSGAELDEVTRVATDAVWELVTRLRAATGSRRGLRRDDRLLLLDLAGTGPRCWICGGAFSDAAIGNFLDGVGARVPLPGLVDILKPRGLVERDLSIEVDHVVPHSKGGGDDENLRLACGWCNRHKSSFGSMYDIRTDYEMRQKAGQGTWRFGGVTVPKPFWTVRVLGVIGACEHREGCPATASDSELTVHPVNGRGAMNPVNLRVTCLEHDPYPNRLQSKAVARNVWGRL